MEPRRADRTLLVCDRRKSLPGEPHRVRHLARPPGRGPKVRSVGRSARTAPPAVLGRGLPAWIACPRGVRLVRCGIGATRTGPQVSAVTRSDGSRQGRSSRGRPPSVRAFPPVVLVMSEPRSSVHPQRCGGLRLLAPSLAPTDPPSGLSTWSGETPRPGRRPGRQGNHRGRSGAGQPGCGGSPKSAQPPECAGTGSAG